MQARAFYSSSIKKTTRRASLITSTPPSPKPKKTTTMHNFDEYLRQGEPDKAEKAKH